MPEPPADSIVSGSKGDVATNRMAAANVRFLFSLILSLSVLNGSLAVLAADPVVSQVTIAQRTDGSRLVDITYDVADADGDTLAVTLLLSDNGGATWEYPVLGTTGDVGPGILPGTGRNIVWDAGLHPETLVGDNYRARVLASDRGVTFEPHSPRNVAITDFGLVDWTDPVNFEIYSRADLLQVMGSRVWTGGSHASIPVVAELKALNPDLKIVGYVSAKTAQLNGASPTADLFWQEWYIRTQPYWVATTEGDTASDFPGNVIINILDPDCRRIMIETIVEFQGNSLNQLDGVYWDYFNNGLWVHPDVDVAGDPDMDGDGIAHQVDTDERVAYKAAQVALVEALRDSLGQDFIQIFNGQRAYADSNFAGLADGMMYELFPTLFFPLPDMAHALDPSYPFSLFHARNWLRSQNGGPFPVLANTWNNAYVDHNGVPTTLNLGDQFRAVALITDVYSSWHTNDSNPYSNTYAWTENDITLGQPLGPPTFEGSFIRRDFQYGKVELEMTSGRYPDPFDYRIWCLGVLVEEIAVPYHYP